MLPVTTKLASWQLLMQHCRLLSWHPVVLPVTTKLASWQLLMQHCRLLSWHPVVLPVTTKLASWQLLMQHCRLLSWHPVVLPVTTKLALWQLLIYNAVAYIMSMTSYKRNITPLLTHWGRVMHICIGNLTIIGSDNGLSPERRQAIIWTNAGILLIGPVGTNLSEISSKIHTFSFTKMHLKMSSGKWRSFCPGLSLLSHRYHVS